MAVAVFRHSKLAPMGFHVEIAAAHIVLGVVHIECQFVAKEGRDKIGHAQVAFAAAHMSPLLVLCVERAVKAG